MPSIVVPAAEQTFVSSSIALVPVLFCTSAALMAVSRAIESASGYGIPSFTPAMAIWWNISKKYAMPEPEMPMKAGNRLSGRKVEVHWKVVNTGSGTMYFQIGAHPAFYFPDFMPETSDRGWFHFGGKTGLEYILVKEKGCADPDSRYALEMDGEYLRLDTHTFDKDALIIDNSQVGKVTLCRQDRTPWLSLTFDAPLVGLWSPPGKNAPFVCIEPWYGRCDRVGYTGEFSGKDWINRLEAGEEFNSVYTIEI